MRVHLMLASALLLVPQLVACDEGGASTDLETESASLVPDGSPEALGLLGFLNAPTTTVQLLDVDVALDSRAASALVAHRDGPDKLYNTKDDNKFDNVAEVDAVAYVGTAAMDKLIKYCVDHGLVPQADSVLGTYDSVVFTIAEGQKTLALANTATLQHLDVDLALDSRAANAIVNARPIATVEALSKLSYVGTTALRILKQAATPPTSAGTADLVAQHLGDASQGLLHTSESDYPFVVVHIVGKGSAPLTAANVKSVIASAWVDQQYEPTLANSIVEVRPLASLMDAYTVPEDWWEDSQLEQLPKWQALRGVLETELLDVQVFRFGRKSGNWLVGAIQVFIIGRTPDGDVVGLETVSVET